MNSRRPRCRSGRSRAGHVGVASAIAAAGLAAGCGGTSHSSTSPSARTTSASGAPSTPSSESPSADVHAQVLDQYEAFWAHVPEAAVAPAARRRQILSPYTSDPELASLLRGMTAQDQRGEVIYGTNLPRARVQTLSEAQGLAVISDCQDSSHSGVERRSDHKKLTVGVARNPVVATMHRSPEGQWRVSFISYPNSSC